MRDLRPGLEANFNFFYVNKINIFYRICLKISHMDILQYICICCRD